jgi:hypothetical protein
VARRQPKPLKKRILEQTKSTVNAINGLSNIRNATQNASLIGPKTDRFDSIVYGPFYVAALFAAVVVVVVALGCLAPRGHDERRHHPMASVVQLLLPMPPAQRSPEAAKHGC